MGGQRQGSAAAPTEASSLDASSATLPSAEQKSTKQQWMPPGSLPLDKPHRRAANSCLRIKTDMLQCYEHSRCYKEGRPFEECLNSNDADWVTDECLWLRKGYAQC